MLSSTGYESLIAEMMKAQAKEEGIDPSKIDASNIQVEATGPTIQVAYAGATVSLPAPSQSTLDQWFTDNGKYIAGSLTTLAAVVIGVTIGKR